MRYISVQHLHEIELLGSAYRNYKDRINTENILDLYQKVMQEDAQDSVTTIEQAAQALFTEYMNVHSCKVSSIDKISELGDFIHTGPDSWGLLPEQYHRKMMLAIEARHKFLKEKRYILRMTVDERASYIKNNRTYYTNNVFVDFAQEIQVYVRSSFARWLEQNAKSFSQESWLHATSVSTTHYLVKQSRSVDQEYSVQVQINDFLRQQLILQQQKYIQSLNNLSQEHKIAALCERKIQLLRKVREYTHIYHCDCEHVSTLHACEREITAELRVLRRPTALLYNKQAANTVDLDTSPVYKAETLKL